VISQRRCNKCWCIGRLFFRIIKKTSAATRYLGSTTFLWVTRVILGNSDIHWSAVGFQNTTLDFLASTPYLAELIDTIRGSTTLLTVLRQISLIGMPTSHANGGPSTRGRPAITMVPSMQIFVKWSPTCATNI
jgi:hypothetical protein